ncbi:MAG: SPOR domain-containing protein [Acidobacteriota bacterium]
MAKRTERFQEEKGPSARHLVMMFLAAVAVCAVFFSLGFVVGYNHSPSRITPVTENVGSPGNIPPTVNPPAEDSSLSPNQKVQAENIGQEASSVPPPVRPKPLPPEPAATAPTQPKPAKPPKLVTRAKPKHKPAAAKQRQSKPSHAADSGGRYVVQVMASRTRADAVRLVRLLETHDYRVFIVSPQQSHVPDHLYRVQVGPFPSRAAAERARHRLEGEGLRPFISHQGS